MHTIASDQEFEVDRILAEKNVNGKKYYLILWKDYHEDKSTWEPKANIVDEGLVETWKTRQQLEQSGDAVPFDVASFEARMKKLEEEKADRYRRRQAKRKSLGIPVSLSASDLDEVSDGDDADDSDSSVEAAEENEIEEPSRPKKSTPKRKKSFSPTKPVKKPLINRVQDSDIQDIEDGSPDAQIVSQSLSNSIAAPTPLTSSKDVEVSRRS
jgi:chromo domain-containing protein 1